MKNILTFSLFTFTFSLALCATAGGAKRIDFEHHFVSTNYLNYCATRTTTPMWEPATTNLITWHGKMHLGKPAYSSNPLIVDLTDLGEKRIAEMDRAGIDVAVLSSAATLEELPAEDAVAIARKSNDDLYNAIKAHPGRFMGAALLPTMQVTAACTELERCVKELGFKYLNIGSVLHAQASGGDPNTGRAPRYIWEEEFEPILAKAAELGVCVYLHPDYPVDADYWDSGFAYASAGMGFGQNVMQTATHLIMNGTFDKYPNLRIILGHMGEYLPYILDRMDFQMNLSSSAGAGFDTNNVKCTETLYHYVVTNANFVITTSGSADTNAFLCAKEALGADRIVFGSDWPYENFANATAFIDTCELTDAEKDGVWSDNAAMYILHETAPVSKDILSIDHVTYSLWQRDTDEDEWREVKYNTVSNCYEVLSNAEAKIVYQAELGYHFDDNSLSVTRMLDTSVSPVTVKPGQDPLPEVVEGSRAPDYAEETGYDWLFNHAIMGKQYENEAANDNGVDIFYVYPTLMTDREEYLHYNGFRLIDDPEMRAMTISTKSSATSAYGAFWKSGRALADLGRVYAPFYRQATNDKMLSAGTKDGEGEELLPGRGAAYSGLTNMLYHGYGYLDVTNALETYFTKWNKNADGSRRKFILAAHSQGSATLMLAMEHYFTQDDAHKQYLKQLVASYQIGMGVDRQWVADLEKNTKSPGFDGVKFASDATGTCVVVSYNTTGETTGEPCASILLPANPVSINPISWTTNDALADKSLNLGSLTNVVPERIVNGLHSAKVNRTRGTVESCGFTEDQWAAPTNIFGEASLHGQDYPAFWEDLHKNAYDRITAATGKFPLVGQPTDYADKENWMAFGDSTAKAGGTDKPFDVFFLYPTAELSPVDYVGDINDDMKAHADELYVQDVQPLETYANMYAPYYRQISSSFLFVTPDADGCQQNLARHVGKTDTFAALDYYFENVNPKGERPFVLVGHSQGSATLKNIFEQYFTGEKKALLKKMIAAYPVGWVFSTDWCKEYGYTFATGASDTNVVITWNTEGPNVPLPSENYFTCDPHGQAINPLNWMTDSTYAPIEANLGSYKGGVPVAGGADGQLDPVNRPGALIVTNSTFKSINDPNLGTETYHITEFGMFRENVCDNILDRGRALTDYARLVVPNLPAHVRMTGIHADGVDLTAVGGGYWATASAGSVEVIVTPKDENPAVVFVNGEREMSLAMKCEGGVWVSAMSETEIKAATKTSDTPTVQLGVVAQRYPWNGYLDINYRVVYANAAFDFTVTFKANDVELGTVEVTGSTTGVFSADLSAIEAFKNKRLGNVKITATLEEMSK